MTDCSCAVCGASVAPMALDPTLRDQLAKAIHDATCPCVHFPDSHPTSRAAYLTAADKAAALLATQVAPVVLPTVEEVREAVIAGTKLGGWGPHTAAQAALNLIASRVRHWVPVEPEDPRVAVVNEWLQEPWPPIADLLARLDALEADR